MCQSSLTCPLMTHNRHCSGRLHGAAGLVMTCRDCSLTIAQAEAEARVGKANARRGLSRLLV
jgi:hypothetical protein